MEMLKKVSFYINSSQYYAVSVKSSNLMEDIDLLEKILKKSTKTVGGGQ